MKNKISELLQIQYPIIQGGMLWCSGWELASAVSNAGGLGIIGSGSMYPDILRMHIRKCRTATDKLFAVNIPLMYPDIEKHMAIIVEEGVKIVFTSAGNPKTWTSFLKEKGIKVVQVVPSVRFAKKSEEAGVDAVVVEGFEAGGHNGREETTTFCLIPMVKEVVSLPVIAAGGIATGRGMLAAMVLGADGVQIGTRFAASVESSGHDNFKNKIVEADEGATMLISKKLVPVRVIKNKFYEQVQVAEDKGASIEELNAIVGKARAKQGMFEGDIEEGKLEAGEIAGLIHKIKPAGQIVKDIWKEYLLAKKEIA